MNYPNVLNAVTVTTTSNPLNIQNDQCITIMFVCANHTSGNGVFSVDVMIGGVWHTGVALIDLTVANTNSQNQTRLTSVTLNSNTNYVVAIDAQSSYEAIRVVCAVTTDGNYSAHVHSIQPH